MVGKSCFCSPALRQLSIISKPVNEFGYCNAKSKFIDSIAKYRFLAGAGEAAWDARHSGVAVIAAALREAFVLAGRQSHCAC